MPPATVASSPYGTLPQAMLSLPNLAQDALGSNAASGLGASLSFAPLTGSLVLWSKVRASRRFHVARSRPSRPLSSLPQPP